MLWGLLACADDEVAQTLFEGASDDGAVAWVLDFGAEPAVGSAEVDLEQTDAEGAPLEAVPTIEPWMPEHGHGVSDAVAVEDLGGGLFHATWTWPMAGTWEVRLDVDGHGGAVDVVVR